MSLFRVSFRWGVGRGFGLCRICRYMLLHVCKRHITPQTSTQMTQRTIYNASDASDTHQPPPKKNNETTPKKKYLNKVLLMFLRVCRCLLLHMLFIVSVICLQTNKPPTTHNDRYKNETWNKRRRKLHKWNMKETTPPQRHNPQRHMMKPPNNHKKVL